MAESLVVFDLPILYRQHLTAWICSFGQAIIYYTVNGQPGRGSTYRQKPAYNNSGSVRNSTNGYRECAPGSYLSLQKIYCCMLGNIIILVHGNQVGCIAEICSCIHITKNKSCSII